MPASSTENQSEGSTQTLSLLEKIIKEGQIIHDESQKVYAQDLIAEFATQVLDKSLTVSQGQDPDTRAHGANEGLHLAEFEKVVKAEALLLRNLGELPRS